MLPRMTGWTRWMISGAVLAAIVAPGRARAEEPATRPAAERRTPGGPDGARRQGSPPGQMIEQMRGVLKDLNLSDDQKTKVEAALKTAADDFRAMRDDVDSTEPRERRERAESIFDQLRQNLHDALNEEQRQTLRKKMSELGPAAGRQRPPGDVGPRRPNENRGPTTRPEFGGGGRPGRLLERLRDNIAKLDLSDDQKTKVKAIVDDTKKQIDEIREGLAAGDEVAREKVGGIMMDVRRQLGEVLTPEQQEKFREMMRPPQPPPVDEGKPRERMRGGDEMMDDAGPPGARRPARNRPPGDEMMDDGEMRGGEGGPPRPRQRPPRDERRARPPTTGPAPGSGANVGARAPAFELTKLDGKPVRLSSFQGRVTVLVFGSYSSPSFRQRAEAIESLASRMGSRANFLIVYTKEAHPAGEWDVERNKDEGISVEQHADAEARLAEAKKAKDKLKLSIPIAPDTMDDAVASAFGAFPNGAVVLSRDGVIVARQQWVDPNGLERRIEQAMKVPTSKPAP